ncbi:hypothetical protein [Embleya hyalina]|uniref:Uncharacterized protein n=1 Tax=Embleya hyalina TaxID=516124 RepID=A0A401YRB9_9ACTN|nr:hypothetical protein [Embleya hyalina]GCD97137.1 hypothetical protein EHYA_04825 [Embleya hyalina]
MRRTFVTLTVLAALLGTAAATPAAAADPTPTASETTTTQTTEAPSTWEPAPPTPPFDYPAGARCDFPVHAEAILDEVVQRVLETHPDGSPKRVAYKGPLVMRVTDTAGGAHFDADAGGSAVVEYRLDGSQRWLVLGPVLTTFRANGGTLPRGVYTIDGAYILDITADRTKTLTMLHGGTDDICARVAR